MKKRIVEGEQWLTLSQASERLSVHPATLRRWANKGDIPVLITPGGHRRFAASDLARFSHEPRGGRKVGALTSWWADQALRDTRQEVEAHPEERWLAPLDEVLRARNRDLGQHLIGLTLQYLVNENGADLLIEAENTGREYGRLALEAGLPLREALEASMFFRDTLIETALHRPDDVRTPPDATAQLVARIAKLLNAVHLAIAEVYDAANVVTVRRP